MALTILSTSRDMTKVVKISPVESAISPSPKGKGMHKYIIKPIVEIKVDKASSTAGSNNVETSSIESRNIEISNISSSTRGRDIEISNTSSSSEGRNLDISNNSSSKIETDKSQSSDIDSSNIDRIKGIQSSESNETGRTSASSFSHASKTPTHPKPVLSTPSPLRQSIIDEHLGYKSSSRSSRIRKRASPLNSSNDF